jgi:hypothetical protein
MEIARVRFTAAGRRYWKRYGNEPARATKYGASALARKSHERTEAIRQLGLRDRAFDRFEGETFDGTAVRRAVGLAGRRAAGRSTAKLLFNTSIKLMTFSWGGLTATIFFGSSACFSLSLEIKTVR